MLIPITVLAILVVLGLTSRRIFGTANNLTFLVIITMALLLFSGLRHETVGVDTETYVARFNSVTGMNYKQAVSFANGFSDSSYYVVSWAFSKIIPNQQAWIAFVSFVFMAGITMICYWESPDYAFSMLYIFCMGMFFFSMTGLRQSLAMGLVMMSYYFVVKRQLIPFIIIILLARQLHQSAIVFLIIYPLANSQISWARLLIAILFFIIVLAFRNSIGAWIFSKLPDKLVDSKVTDYINSTKQYTASGFVIQLVMYVFCMRYHDAVVGELPHREALYNLAFLGLMFQAAAMSIAEFFRISMYFNWTYMVLLPICMQYEQDQRNYEFVRTVVIVVFVAYFFYSTLNSYGIVPYNFFWQKV